MSKKVLLVGHCGPDSGHLRMSLKKAIPGAEILSADEGPDLERLADGVDLVLFNRELGYGFEPATGVEMIRSMRPNRPNLKMMLVSNYPEAQQAAEAAGALPGFGKRELGSPRVMELLKEAVGAEAVK